MNLYWIIFQAVVLVCFILYLLKRIWGIDALAYIVQARPVLVAIGSVVEAVAKVLPSKQFSKIITVLKAASEGAKSAEELWLMGNLEKEERNAKAKSIAKAAIAKAGVDVTPQIEMIINGIIEVVCVLLPHGAKPETETEE